MVHSLPENRGLSPIIPYYSQNRGLSPIIPYYSPIILWSVPYYSIIFTLNTKDFKFIHALQLYAK